MVSAPPVDPLQPLRLEIVGKSTASTAVSESEAVAFRSKLPDPVERKNRVFVPAS